MCTRRLGQLLLGATLVAWSVTSAGASLHLPVRTDPQFSAEVTAILNELRSSGSECAQVLQDLEKPEAHRHDIRRGTDPFTLPNIVSRGKESGCLACQRARPPKRCASGCSGTGSTLVIPSSLDGYTCSSGVRVTSAHVLCHELSHALDIDRGILDKSFPDKGFADVTETKAVRRENSYRTAKGECNRPNYYYKNVDLLVPVKGAKHCPAGQGCELECVVRPSGSSGQCLTPVDCQGLAAETPEALEFGMEFLQENDSQQCTEDICPVGRPPMPLPCRTLLANGAECPADMMASEVLPSTPLTGRLGCGELDCLSLQDRVNFTDFPCGFLITTFTSDPAPSKYTTVLEDHDHCNVSVSLEAQLSYFGTDLYIDTITTEWLYGPTQPATPICQQRIGFRQPAEYCWNRGPPVELAPGSDVSVSRECRTDPSCRCDDIIPEINPAFELVGIINGGGFSGTLRFGIPVAGGPLQFSLPFTSYDIRSSLYDHPACSRHPCAMMRSLELSTSSVVGGESFMASVVLTQPAPYDLPIRFYYGPMDGQSYQGLTPLGAVVSSGQMRATFTITSTPTPQDTSVWIWAGASEPISGTMPNVASQGIVIRAR